MTRQSLTIFFQIIKSQYMLILHLTYTDFSIPSASPQQLTAVYLNTLDDK